MDKCAYIAVKGGERSAKRDGQQGRGYRAGEAHLSATECFAHAAGAVDLGAVRGAFARAY